MILVKGFANIILSMVMGKQWGIIGVLAATTITSVTTLFWYEPKIVYKYFKKSALNEILYHVVSITLLFISFGLTYWVVKHMKGAGFVYLICKAGICGITANAVYVILFIIGKIRRRRIHER